MMNISACEYYHGCIFQLHKITHHLKSLHYSLFLKQSSEFNNSSWNWGVPSIVEDNYTERRVLIRFPSERLRLS